MIDTTREQDCTIDRLAAKHGAVRVSRPIQAGRPTPLLRGAVLVDATNGSKASYLLLTNGAAVKEPPHPIPVLARYE